LPAETFTEKKLGITDRRDIGTKVSLEDYIKANRENMVQTGNLWEDTIDRIGRWVDFKGAYKTMDKDYMESVWWAFKELYEKGKIYEGERVLMYCTRDATPLSKAEVTMDAGAYQDVTDPSVYVKFNVTNEEYSLLAWTTTPWTLQANTAVAVHSDLDYVEVELQDERLVLGKELAGKVLTDAKHQPLDYKVVREFKGKELVGKTYEPLFTDHGTNAHKVWHADYVSAEDGSGLVHIAPAYGEEDFALAQEKNIPVVHVLDESGVYTEGDWEGENVWEVNKTIAKNLHERGVVLKVDYIRHSYPHCHRCGTRLMYRAHPSWFMEIQGQKQKMLIENTENITWFPGHIKHGRFEKTVETAPDWNLSRDRFWATAMPVWKGVDGDGKERIKVVGSYAELKELSGVELEDYHRPWVDDIEFDLDGVHYTRIEKVMDCWFESGSMPFAQFHYPFENKEKFEANFPGDFIVEYVGQVRAWFYYMHAVNVGLFGHNAFKNVIVTGNVAGNDGRKMSKSYGNFTDPNELMDQYSADSLRFLLMQSPLLNGEDFALMDKDVGDVARKLSMVWNMYDFFTMYAEVDGWEWDGEHQDPTAFCTNPLDKWIISRVHQLTQEVATHMDGYDIPSAIKPILPFIDDASNWYVRRSRRRFWKSGDDEDKNNAYRTLHYVLVQLSMVLAPFTPFLAEELYQKLTGGESVHLLDWPQVGHVNELVVQEMATVRQYVNEALALRAKSGVKVRQPLQSVSVPMVGQVLDFASILTEELNVKEVLVVTDAELSIDLTMTSALKREGFMREVVRQVQNARKQADLNVDDRIALSLSSDDNELSAAIEEYKSQIMTEVLAVNLQKGQLEDGYSVDVTVEGRGLAVALKKADG
jgi:isoleucyl-tRNA synthetase